MFTAFQENQLPCSVRSSLCSNDPAEQTHVQDGLVFTAFEETQLPARSSLYP